MTNLLLGNFFSEDNVPSNVANGFTNGIVTGYYGDVLTNLFNGYPLLQVDSTIYEYGGSAYSGGLGSLTGYHLDGLANTIVVTSAFYFISYWNELNQHSINEIILGIVAVAFLSFVFGENTRKSFFEKTPASETNTDLLALLLVNIFFAIQTV